MINWKSRVRNKTFLSATISMGLLLVKNYFNIELPYDIDFIVELGLTAISTLGIIIDPSTEGFSDMQRREELEEIDETFECLRDVLKILCGEEQ